MDTSFILLSFLNAKLNFRHFEFEVMEMPRNDKEWETYKVKTDIFLKPEARAGQSDSTSIRERLGTVALSHSSSRSGAVCFASAQGLETSRMAGWREAVKAEDRHDRQPCPLLRRRRNLAHSYSCLWIVKFNGCGWPLWVISVVWLWNSLLWTPMELPSLACHF